MFMTAAGRTALVIDDAPEFRRFVQDCLTNHGFHVWSAGDGAEAVELARIRTPDVILLDLILPVVNGFDVCATLRRDPRTQHIPVIMMTGAAQPANITKSLSEGANFVLLKPFDELTLVTSVRRVLGLGTPPV
jgi:CheY-like chemotaxis protein